MSIDTDDKIRNPEVINMECPFERRCKLPKGEEICNFPDFKVCPEYQEKAKKINLEIL